MSSSKNHCDRQQLINAITLDIEKMQSNPDCTIGDVGKWFTENGNHISKVLTGRAGRKLLSYCTNTMYVMPNEDSDLMLTVTGFWNFFNNRGSPLEIDSISKYMPALGLQPHNAFSRHDKMWGIFEFNLSLWPSLAADAITHHLRSATNPIATTSAREFDYENIQTLLTVFYPSITNDLLMTAIDLGILNRTDTEFRAWLNASRVNKSTNVIKNDINLEFP